MTDRRHPSGGGRAPTDRPRPSAESDQRLGAATAGGVRDIDELPTPAWVPTDDVIGPAHDRQVLVVGRTPAGLALTRLLRAAGYDPVLANGTDARPASRVAFLSPAAMAVLDAVDVGRRLLDAGVRIDGVDVASARNGNDGVDADALGPGVDGAGRTPAVIVPTWLLCRTLGSGLPSETTARDRTVGSISTAGDGVAVRFDDGVREWFDLIVDAGAGTLRSDRSSADGAGRYDTLRQYEATIDGRIDTRVRDVWLPNGLVQRLPTPGDGGTLVRVTTAASGSTAVDRVIETATRESDIHAVPDVEAFEEARVRQVRLSEETVPEGWWGRDRVACCGRSACPTAPAAGLGVSLGVTDALGLVSVLTRTRTDVPETVDAYATGRARRFDSVRRAAAGSDRTPDVLESTTELDSTAEPLRSLRALRAMALEPFVGTAPAALWSGATE